MPAARSLALVESATQLLNVGEWVHAAGDTDDLRVAVLAPADPHTVRQLHSVAAIVRTLGVRVDVLPVRVRGTRAARALAGVAGQLARTERLLVGDPFSRLVQTLLPLCRASRVVVVDDGTATWHYADCIAAGAPLVRWDRPAGEPDRRAVRATAFFSPSDTREITVFSCLEHATPIGAVAIRNDYAWTRSRRRPQVVPDRVDVLGTSLVATGTVRREAYLEAVRGIATGVGEVRYIAHRREADDLAVEIGAIPGVHLVRAALPVELELREGSVAEHVLSFPSTVAYTLPIVLGDLEPPVRIDVRGIDPSWFTPDSSAQAREFVTRIASGRRADPPASQP